MYSIKLKLRCQANGETADSGQLRHRCYPYCMGTRTTARIVIKKTIAGSGGTPLSHITNPLFLPRNLQNHGIDLLSMVLNTYPQELGQNIFDFRSEGKDVENYVMCQEDSYDDEACYFNVSAEENPDFDYMIKSLHEILWERSPLESMLGKGNFVANFPGVKAIFLNSLEKNMLLISITEPVANNREKSGESYAAAQIYPFENGYQIKVLLNSLGDEGLETLNELLFSLSSSEYQEHFFGGEKVEMKKLRKISRKK